LSHGDVSHHIDTTGKERHHRLKLPAQHTIYPGKRLVIVRFASTLTLESIERYATRLRTDPAFDPDFSEIVDLTGVEKIELEAGDFVKLADQVDVFGASAKRAFVAGNAMQQHAARMHKILATQRNLRIFRTVESAEKWIASRT
jgi:hypothetical protein